MSHASNNELAGRHEEFNADYEKLKALTRGQRMSRDAMRRFIEGLDLPEEARRQLLALSPASYTGTASDQARDLPPDP